MCKKMISLGAAALALTPGLGAAQEAGFQLDVYGFLKTGYTAAQGGVESFGRQNASAPTAASLPLLAVPEDQWTSSFHVSQSRLGVHLDPVQELRATVEVDFINFDQASPTVQALPRLRIATLTWRPAAGQELTLGQTWDLYSPLNPVHSNFVGGHFFAGNAGFMRQQLIWRGQWDAVKAGLAVGMPGNNPSPNVGNLEKDIYPSLAALASVQPVKGVEVGASGIVASLFYGDAERRRQSLSANLFAELKADGWIVRGEGYWGQNLGNLGTLTLSHGHMDADVQEAGAWLSVKKTLADKHELSLTGGFAQILNEDNMLAGYSVGGDGAFARAGGNGPGIERNVHLRGGYAFNFAPGASLFVEPLWFLTRHHLMPTEAASAPERASLGVEMGAIYRF